MKAVLRWASRLLAMLLSLVLLLLIAGVLLLLFTARGGPWAFQVAEYVTGGQIKAVGVQGGLLDRLSIQRLSLTSADAEVIIKDAELRWLPRELLRRQLHIQRLHAGTVDVYTRPTPPKPFTPLPDKLPLTVVLDDARVQRLRLHQNLQASVVVQLPGQSAPQAQQIEIEPRTLSNIAASASWDGQGLRIRRAGLWLPEVGGVGAAGLLRLEGDAIHFLPLAIAGPAQLMVNGVFGLNGRASALTVRGEQLQWPLGAEPQVQASGLLLQFNGLPQAAQIDVQARLLAAIPEALKEDDARRKAPPPLGFAFKAQAQLGKESVRLPLFSLLAEAPGKGSLSGSGSFAWQPTVKADALFKVEQLNPGMLLRDWPGQLNGQFEVSTLTEAGVPDVRFSAALAKSQLRGKPFALDAAGRYLAAATPQLAVQKLLLTSGSAKLSAKGQVLPGWKAEASLSAGNLADLYPGLAGSAKADVALEGPLQLPKLQAKASAGSLRFQELRLGGARLQASINPAGQSTATLEASGLQAAGRVLSTLKAGLDGSLASHRLTLASTAAEGSVALALQGGYTPKAELWKGTLQSATVDAAQAPKLSLLAPAALTLSKARQQLEEACFAANEARLCLAGEHAGEATKAKFSVRQFALATLQPLLPKDVLVTANAEGEGRVQLSGSTVGEAELNLRLGAGQIVLPQMPPLALQGATLSLLPQGGNWAATLNAQTDRGRVQASVSTPRAGSDWPAKPLSGTLDLSIPSLAFLQGFASGTEGLEGKLEGKMSLTGVLAAPRFAGRMELSEGRVRVPVAGLNLTNIRAVATGDLDGGLRLNGQLQSGEGVLAITGSATSTAEGLRATVAAKGENIQAADLADYRVWVSPDLQLTYAPDGASLTGRIGVPKAAITPRKLAAGAVAPSRDTVVVGREKPAVKSLPITAEVTVALGDDVRFEGFGLKARIEGEVTARDAPGLGTTRGRGELRVVEGRYKAYGQDLKLETGRLLFAGGPLTDPTVDFRAVRTLREDFYVAVLVRGTLAAPVLDLASNDADLSREEKISWLVLGRPLSSTSSTERNQVNSAALSLGLSGGDFLAGRLGKTLGLDEVSVGAQPGDDPSAARVTIGKYLSPKLYVSYGVGLFERNINVFRLLYDLGGGFKLRTEAGLNTGGDILYTVEK